MTHGTRTELACLQAATRDLMARVSFAKQAEDTTPDASYIDACDARDAAEQTLARHVCNQLGVVPSELRILADMLFDMPGRTMQDWLA